MDIGTLTGRIELEDEFSDALQNSMVNVTNSIRRVSSDLKSLADGFVSTGKAAALGIASPMSAAGSVASNAIRSVNIDLKDLGEKMVKVGKIASIGITAPIVAAGAAAIAASMQISGAMGTIARVTGASGESLASMQESFRTVFKDVPDSAAVVAQVMATVNVRLRDTAKGVEFLGEDLETITKQMLSFANVNRVDVAGATQVVTTLMKALELDVTTVGLVMDKLTYASQQSGASVTELAQGVIAGGMAFVEMGFGLDQSIALFTQFKQVGANVTDVTASLGMAMSQLAEQGITDAAAAFDTLLKKIKDAPTFMDGFRIATEVFGAKAARKLTEEIRFNTYSIDAMVESLQHVEGLTAKTAAATETFTEKVAKLRNQVTMALEPIGTQMLNALQNLLPLFTRMAGAVTTLTTWFAKLPVGAQATALGFAGLLAAAGPAIVIFGSIAGAVAKIIPLFAAGSTGATLLAGALGFFTLPVTLTIAAVVALVAALAYFDLIGPLVEKFKSLAATVGGLVVEAFHRVKSAIITASETGFGKLVIAIARLSWDSLIVGARLFWEGLKVLVTGVMDLSKWVVDIYTRFYSLTESFNTVRLAGSAFSTALGFVWEKADKLAETLSYLLDLLGMSISGRGAIPEVTRAMDEFADGFPPVISSTDALALLTKQLAEDQKKLADAAEGAAGSTDGLSNQLEKLRKGALEPLTAAQKSYIVEADKYGVTQEKIQKATGASAEAIHLYLESLKTAKEDLKEYTKAVGENLKIAAAQQAASWKWQADQLDFNGVRALQEVEKQYKEQQAALNHNNEVQRAQRQADWNRRAAELDSNGERAMAKIKEHYDQVGQYSFSAMQVEANRVRKIYEEMAAHPERFSQLTIQRFKEIAIAAQNAADGISMSFADAFKTLLESIPGLLRDAFTGGGGFMGAMKALAVSAAELFGKIFAERLSASIAKSMAGSGAAGGGGAGAGAGAAAGAAAGTAGTSVSTSIGAALGPGLMSAAMTAGISAAISLAIIGGIALAKKLHQAEWEKIMSDIGRDLGVQISESLAKQIEKDAKEMGSRIGATLLSLNEIIAEAGGVEKFGVEKAIDSLRSAFSWFEMGELTIEQLSEVFEENFGELIPHMLSETTGLLNAAGRELIALAEANGVVSESMQAFNLDQLSLAVGGLSAALAPAADAYEELARLQEQYANAGSDQMAGLAEQMAQQQAIIDAAGISTQAAATGMAAALTASFMEMVAQGMSMADALAAIAPAVADLQIQLENTGLSGGEAFEQLNAMITLASDEITGPAIDAVSGLGAALVGLSNSGILTQEMFVGLAGQVGSTFDSLIEQGYDGTQAMMLMQPTLQTIWELQQDFGYEVDATTQALLDEAAAQGMVGESMRDINEQILNVLTAIAEVLGATIPGAAATAGASVQNNFGNPSTGSAAEFQYGLTGIVMTLEGDLSVAARNAGAAITAEIGGAAVDAMRAAEGGVAGMISALEGVPAAAVEAADEMMTAFENMNPVIDVGLNWPSMDRAPSYASRGGLVTQSGVQYLAGGGHVMPRGTDTVPAMLTPGERVLSVQQNREYDPDNGEHGEGFNHTLQAIEGLRHDLNTKLPRAVGRAVDAALMGLRTTS